MARVEINEETNARLRDELEKLNTMLTELYASIATLTAYFADAVETDAVVCTTETITITNGVITSVDAND